MIHHPNYGRFLGALLPLVMGVTVLGGGIPRTHWTPRGANRPVTDGGERLK